MRFDKQSFLWKSGLLLIAGTLVLACAEERDPIDRVQPYALKKEFFIGPDYTDTRDDPEFWGRTTVTDVGYGASQDLLFPSTIGQNVARLKWQVTQDLLIARASYERIIGSDGNGAPKKDNRGNAVGSETHDGQIVAMFLITSHFDIANDYNSVTGEKVNVVSENGMDRPWYDRDFIRVNWSMNLATDSYDFNPLDFIGLFGTTYEPIAYYVDDPNDKDAPVFDMENGYFDVTTKAFAKPGTIDLSQWGIPKYPACFLPLDIFGGSFPMGNCNPVELTLRHSFRRVVDTDFEPAEHDGGRFTSFGGFVTERYGYARNYGMTDTLHHRLLNRYNIWERSHYYTDPTNMVGEVACYTSQTTEFGEDPHRDLNNDGTEDECEAVQGDGSRCDTFKQKCTLPFKDRVAKPLVWYYTNGSDLRYFEPSDYAAHEWDVALRVAVQTARYAECNRTNGEDCATKYPVYHGQIDDGWDAIVLAREVDACRRTDSGLTDPATCNGIADSVGKARGYDPGVIAIAKMPEMIVLCHSPVQAHDPMACGQRRLPVIKNDKGTMVDATGEDCTWAINLPEDEVTNEIADLIEACDNSTQARLGDLRFDTINVFHQPQTPSPWGIMVSAIDPTTGENISTSCNVWSWVNDYWSQLAVDQVRLVKGDLDVSDISGATWGTNYSKATEASARGGVAGTMSKDFVDQRVSEFATGKADVKAFQTLGSQLKLNKVQLKANLNEVRQKFLGVRADGDKMNGNTPLYAARAAALAGTEIEAELLSEPIRQLYGVSNVPMTEEIMNRISPLRGASLDLQRELKRMIQNAMHKRGMCILEANMAEAPLSVAPLADVLEEKFGPVKGASEETLERMRDYVARKAHYSVVTHEMGHSIAHRH
ncbi:MAG: hypothetical protein MUC50_02770, partial [Myxococcota bacterium]|nr:hypothetical protein [Myxococcota bacterium]